VQELCHALSAAVGMQAQPEEVAGAVQALISGMSQVLLGLVGQAAALEGALAEAQAENGQLLADGAALAGAFFLWLTRGGGPCRCVGGQAGQSLAWGLSLIGEAADGVIQRGGGTRGGVGRPATPIAGSVRVVACCWCAY
jgi:hypothetical protein